VGDFNGDGKQDLAVGNFNSDNVSILLRDCLVVSTKVQGRGSVANQRFRVSQVDDSSKLGQFTFCDPAAGMCTAKARVQNLSITGNTASFSGQGRLADGTIVRFTVSVTDNGEPGTSDTMWITLSNGYTASGTLTSGDIRIQ
jgi:FG-GAP repeat protein